MNKKGLTLIEILVSLVILLLVVASLASVFVAGKMQIAHTRSRLTGTELGKYFLDPFQMYVRQDSWDDQINNKLYTPSTPSPYSNSWTDAIGLTIADSIGGRMTFAPIIYTVSRVLDASNSDTGLRRVVVTINWTESPPP